MDAIIAVGLLFIMASLLAVMSTSYSSPELDYQKLYYTGKDAMNVIERGHFSAVADLMPVNFTEDCNITEADMNKSILDVIGYLWAQNSTSYNQCAENLTRDVLNLTLPKSFGYEVMIDGVSIYKEGEPKSHLSRLHTIVSGYELGKPVSGYFASAYIARMARSTSSYVYFGGYEGDGNITKTFKLPDDANVTNAYFEANMGNNFTLYINGNAIGPLYISPENFTADNWTLCSDFASCDAYFLKGGNAMTINFTDLLVSNYVGGGFLKVTYNTTKPDTLGVFATSNKTYVDNYWFPGINGIMNIYSGFRVPGVLNNMTLYVHYNNSILVNGTGIPVFLIIGDSEIFRSNQSGDVIVSLDDSEMRTFLDYGQISNATVPIRFGMETFHILAGTGSSDVVLITDRSGSMGTCDVWSNVSYDCEPYNCDDRCSVTCDTDQSVCEDICGGTWDDPVTPGFFICVGEVPEDYCCENQNYCNQCGGTYGKRDRINVAIDADKDFVDTVLGFHGSRAGLACYGTEMCSDYMVTYNQTMLNQRIDAFSDDCGGTCICCGINRARKVLMEGDSINALNNSYFLYSSLDSWNESGTVTVSDATSVTETYEFEGPSDAADPSVTWVSGNVYAIAYETSSDSNGWLKTVDIDESGNIGSVIDSFEFDSGTGEDPEIIHVIGDVYAIFYRSGGSDGWLRTVEISADGTIAGELDNMEYDSSQLYEPSVVRVASDIYAVAYRGNSDEGRLRTIEISSDGTIVGQADSYQFESGSSEAFDPDIVHVTGNTYAIAFRRDSTDEGIIETVDIDASGNIGSVIDSFVYETEGSTYESYENDMVRVSDGIFAIAYRRNGDDDGWLKTVDIDASGNIGNVIDIFEFDDSSCNNPDIRHMIGDYFMIAYSGAGSDGWLKILQIDDKGEINDKTMTSLEFVAGDVSDPAIINISDEAYAIAYRNGADGDGRISTIGAASEDLDLHEYWYVDSDTGLYGALSQNFTVPTGELENAYLKLTHSTSDSYFDGTAYVSCNLTHRYYNGSVYLTTTSTVWSDDWDSADNPVGPVTEEVNITQYIDDMEFTYTLKCGADVTPGGGRTIVAFDDMEVNFTMDRYKAMLVMSDGAATIYCDSFDDYVGAGSSSTSDLIDEQWAINASCYARDMGIEVYSVAFGTGADTTVMQQIACWNCSTNDWIPGEEEDNCSRYYQSNNAEELQDMYREIAQNMGAARYNAQTISVLGDVSLDNILYPESYIRYNYTPTSILKYGEVSIALESERFGGSVESPKYGYFYVPSGGRLLDARVMSYSSGYWTSSVGVDTSVTGGWTEVYNISGYGSDYVDIGDPFAVNLPVNLIAVGDNNTVTVNTRLEESYPPMGGSPYDKVVYYMGVEGIVGYGDVHGTLDNATQEAIERLEDKLSDFNITMLEVVTPYQYVSELPSLWGPSVMEIRVWT